MNVCFFKFQIIWLILLFDMCLWLGKRLLLFCQITLGHEIGAGAACLKCKDKCEGFDLHFWRFVLASFLHIYAMLSFMHVVFITINESKHVGSSLIWLLFFSPSSSFFQTHQHAIPYLSGKKLSHRESPGHYLHSVGFAEVRTTGACARALSLQRWCVPFPIALMGFQEFFELKDINVDTGLWMQSLRLHLCVCFYAAGKGN